MSDMGIGGYTSLMKTQKNPYERNIATTNSILSSMPKDGGVTGLEGLGKLPLMYQQGVDTANAQQFDQQLAADEMKQVEGIKAYQQQQAIQERKAKALASAIELSKTDYKAANSLLAESVPDIAAKVKFTGNDKDGWKDIEVKGEDGYTTKGFLNPVHFTELAELKKSGKFDDTTVKELFAKNFSPYSRYETKDINKDPTLTGHIVVDKTSATGFSYAGSDGEIMTKNAPAPKEPKNNSDGWSEKEDLKFYKQKATEVRSLESKADAGFKGQLVIDGVMRSFDGSKESQDALRQLAEARKMELTGNPTYSSLVQRHDPQWLKPKPDIKGDPSKHTALPPAGAKLVPGKQTKTGGAVFQLADGSYWTP